VIAAVNVFWFLELWEIFLLAERLLVSHEGPCSMELVSIHCCLKEGRYFTKFQHHKLKLHRLLNDLYFNDFMWA
jgi:hypothetical protein